MSDRNPTEQTPPTGPARTLRCEEWESLLADALDGTLAAADRAAFDTHGRDCLACAKLLEETKKGREWLSFLGDEPEVPAGLMGKILARTTGAAAAGAPVAAPLIESQPAWYRTVIPASRQAFEPRLIMSAAMAFFSIAMTLSLTGVKLSDLRLADLRPAMLRSTITRQFYSANEHVVKYYENLRFVYEVEARVRELRRTSDTVPPEQNTERNTEQNTEQAPRPQPAAPKGGPAGPRQTPDPGHSSTPAGQQHGVAWPGEIINAAYRCPERGHTRGRNREQARVHGVCRSLTSTTGDRAQRSLV